MNEGKNIYNAFDVVRRTYRDLNKFITDCIKYCDNESEFTCLSPNFLRYKSDNDIYGWFVYHLFLVFKYKKGNEKSLYVIDINLYDISDDDETPFWYEEPTIDLAKFTYNDCKCIKDEYKKGDYYIFRHPLYDLLGDSNLLEDENFGEIVFPEEISKKSTYSGVERIVCTDFPLLELNKNNMVEKVFGTFKKMEKM